MVFKYMAARQQGGKDRGIITADNLETAEKILREQNLTILKIESVQSSVTDSPFFNLKERSATECVLAGFFITSSQIEQALGQLATMLEGGVPILNAFQTVAAQSGHFLSRALFCTANKLQAGKPLADAVREEMPFLGNIIIGMISAGEANGDVDKMCNYSAELLERKRKVRGQVLQAMAYPALVILVTIGIVTFLMLNVIPKIMKFLDNRQAKLPPVTQLLVDVTHYLEANGLYLLAIPVFAVLILVVLRKNPELAHHIDHCLLRLPVIGKVFRASSNMLWCRTLGILLRSGINIIAALEYTLGALNNFYYRNELAEMKKIVSQGHPLSTALRVSGIHAFIPLADAMLVVGENTGQMDTGLLKVAEFCDTDLQKRIALLSKLIEPALFVVVGGIVGFVYIAFFMGLMAASTSR